MLQASFAREARVGTRRDSNRLEISTRRASTLALHPPPTLSGDVGTRLALTKMMRGLCSELNGGSLPPLAPTDTELGYVYYPVDGYYARHVDVRPPLLVRHVGAHALLVSALERGELLQVRLGAHAETE